MGLFLSYWISKLKISHFGRILAHKSARIVTRRPKFLHLVENIVVHLFKSKSQDLWTGILVISLQSLKKPGFGPKMALK